MRRVEEPNSNQPLSTSSRTSLLSKTKIKRLFHLGFYRLMQLRGVDIGKTDSHNSDELANQWNQIPNKCPRSDTILGLRSFFSIRNSFINPKSSFLLLWNAPVCFFPNIKCQKVEHLPLGPWVKPKLIRYGCPGVYIKYSTDVVDWKRSADRG